MFKKVLIANRGNIAVNIIRACKELGIETITVFSDVDKESIHVRYADKAYFLGRAKYQEDYTRKDRILQIAQEEEVDAIHPGFGFLAQSRDFMLRCKELGIKVIGEDPEKLVTFMDKAEVKSIAEELKIPVVKGTKVESIEDLDSLKTPLLIKPTFGYAGRGIHYVENKSDKEKMYKIALKESEFIYGDKSVYAEEYIKNAYLIEVCVVGNGKDYRCLPTIDSSLRRKFQKIISECPAEYIDIKIRKKIMDYSKKLAKKLEISNMGTFEFLVDGKKIYFLEFNSRLPVSYTVLEMLTGFNLIKEQINITAGLDMQVEEIALDKIKGNAFECRIHAEDYFNKFKPSAGVIENLIIPGGKDVRVEFDYFNGDEVSSYYDSQVARILVKALRRNEMINKIRWVLEGTKISGISSTLPFVYNVVNTKLFENGKIVSDFITHIMRERRFKKVREKGYIASIVSCISFHNENQKKNLLPRMNMDRKQYSPWTVLGRTKILKKWE